MVDRWRSPLIPTYAFDVFGLQVTSDAPIPGVGPTGSAAQRPSDVHITMQQPPAFVAPERAWHVWYCGPQGGEAGQPIVRIWRRDPQGHFRVRYRDGCEFWVDRSGAAVWATWPKELTAEDASIYLLGPILGLVLRVRGRTCLHASAVSIDGHAIALAGPGGAGKSTLAAAFAGRGVPVLSDDVTVLTSQGGAFVVQPGWPHARLWPSAVESLYGSRDALPPLVPTDPLWDKRRLDLGGSFERMARPLGAVYILGERQGMAVPAAIQPIGGSDAVMAMVANGYVSYMLTPAMRAAEFRMLTLVVDCTPIRRVSPCADIGQVNQLAAAIADDFARR